VAFLDAWRQGRYDRSRGRVSRFLAAVLRARYLDLRRSRLRRDEVSLDACEDLGAALSDESVDRAWRVERQRTILARSLAQLRAEGVDERTLEAFEMYAVRGVDVEAVVERVGMSRSDVYSIKYRLVRRLQPIVARLDELYEDL
jgi:DNA-directed RNA polymerase specialized sigma24 family protein